MWLTVTPGMGPIDVHLQRRAAGATAPKFTRNPGLLAGLLLAAGLHVAIGGTMTILGTGRWGRAVRRNEGLLFDGLLDAASAEPSSPTGLELVEAAYPTADYHRDLGRAMNLELAGTAALAGGLGAMFAALPVAGRERRRIAWISTGVGVVMTAGGAVWLAAHLDKREARLAESEPARRVTSSDLRPLGAAQTGAALLTGLGIGLVVYPCIALLSDTVRQSRERHDRARVTPYMSPGQAGLVFHGRF
jgi:hypothetical protein